MVYQLQGLFLEACDCHVICPCWLDEEPHDAKCTGLIAWHIEKGHVDGVDVSGLTVSSVSHHDGHRRSGGQEVVLFIDENATHEQADALRATFTGVNGGPLEELKQLAGAEPTVRSAPMRYTHDGKSTTLHIGDAGETATVDMAPQIGATNRVTTLADSALAVFLGTPAEIGRSSRMLINVNRAPLDTDIAQRSATRGRFAYHHE